MLMSSSIRYGVTCKKKNNEESCAAFVVAVLVWQPQQLQEWSNAVYCDVVMHSKLVTKTGFIIECDSKKFRALQRLSPFFPEFRVIGPLAHKKIMTGRKHHIGAPLGMHKCHWLRRI